MLGLWATAAILDLVISMAWHWTYATPLRVAATYTCGFCFSLAGFRFAARGDASASYLSTWRMLAVVLPSGVALFAIDVVGRAYAHGESPLTA